MSEHASHNLPPTFKGLQFTSPTEPASVVDVPTPLPATGTVILRPLYSNIVPYAREIYCNGNPRAYNYPSPMIPGTSCICRIAAAAPDTPHLKAGMLVFMSGLLRPRDNISVPPSLQGMYMGATAESQALMKGEWRNGSWAELVKVPAENIHILNEQVLTKGLGYDIEDLGYISTLAVAYGGLSDVGVRPGETVLVAPATGNFGSAAVFVALAMGAAKVIAMGRSQEKLKAVLEGAGDRVVTVPLSGNVEDDAAALQAHGPIDVYFDISPPFAGSLPHIKAGIIALRPKGRMSIMGGARGDVGLPYLMIVFKGLTLQGTFMYSRQQADELIKLVETGLLRMGKRAGMRTAGKFRLDKWEEAIEHAYNAAGPGKTTYFVPNGE
ncbi:hypothetical protein TOPH_03280 [Tolypocladium ophioglossoides CBS 100239]|uniref:Alcohol dehydrogenase-like C-terminal domain-containing protein n=1 Tax=Tolypocladium ophioglossoides (strain CBS 100239) TaxID=1163406 RepID=A0A0L0NCT8_TOLOC|nr:hypothetical protein TOPH_03280 [Tolypocladium ophioglossoides CBS 100239]